MIINIIQDDIVNGIRDSPDSCPVALAIKRTLSKHVVYIGLEHAWLRLVVKTKGGNVWADCELPQIVRDFIENFDNGRNVEVFSFDLKYNYSHKTNLFD